MKRFVLASTCLLSVIVGSGCSRSQVPHIDQLAYANGYIAAMGGGGIGPHTRLKPGQCVASANTGATSRYTAAQRADYLLGCRDFASHQRFAGNSGFRPGVTPFRVN